MTRQVIDIATRQPLVPSEPDGVEPVEVEPTEDRTPKTDREWAIYWAGHQAGWADHFADEERRTAEFLAEVDRVVAQRAAGPGRHLKPVS